MLPMHRCDVGGNAKRTRGSRLLETRQPCIERHLAAACRAVRTESRRRPVPVLCTAVAPLGASIAVGGDGIGRAGDRGRLRLVEQQRCYGSCALTAKRHRDRLDFWLQRFGRAWEARDRDLVVALFGEDGCYRETPFDEPLRGGRAIGAYWSKLPAARDDIRFSYEILAVSARWGIVHWHGSYTRLDGATHVELDGILLVALDDEGRCRDFHEWSNRRELAPSRATG